MTARFLVTSSVYGAGLRDVERRVDRRMTADRQSNKTERDARLDIS
jgi:hypothetical protein